MADLILPGNATPSQVLSGQTFSAGSQTGVAGTMPNNGTLNYTPNTNNQAVPAGYTSGGTVAGDAGLVTGNIKAGTSIFGVAGKSSVVDTADATTSAGHILSGETAYVNGSKATGTMANQAGYTTASSIGVNGGTTIYFRIPQGAYITPSGGAGASPEIQGTDVNLVSGNILSGKTIFGVAGNVIQASGNAGASQVLAGYSASNSSGGFSGSMPNQGSPTWTPGTSNQGLAAGYYSGGTVQGSPNLVPGNILNGVNIFGIVGNVIQGKRMATGTGVTVADAGNGQPGLHVTGLTFAPYIAILYKSSSTTDNGYTAAFAIYKKDGGFNGSGTSTGLIAYNNPGAATGIGGSSQFNATDIIMNGIPAGINVTYFIYEQ